MLTVRPERKLPHIVAVVAEACGKGIPKDKKIARMEAGVSKRPNNISLAMWSSSPRIKNTIWDATPDSAETTRSLGADQVETSLKAPPMQFNKMDVIFCPARSLAVLEKKWRIKDKELLK